MENLLIAFVTGLTTGGLSCLAVQGGLLASSLANQIEKDLQAHTPAGKKNQKRQTDVPRSQMALPIALFLVAKLVAYTMLGFLLGFVGSMFQLSPLGRAVLQFAIGIFMVGSALRMLNVHPIFRYFAFEPPAFLRRRIRKTAASSRTSYLAPVFLGILTVLIPCGITQAMMAVAISTADPLSGAALMFSFTLGTSPVFFAVAYFATRLGEKLEKNFIRFVAIIVLVLGLFAIDTGLNLAGSPVSLTRAWNNLWPQPTLVEAKPVPDEKQGIVSALDSLPISGPESVAVELEEPEGDDVITIRVKNNGYEPSRVHAKAGVPLKLRLVSDKVYSCSLAFVIPALKYTQTLEPTGVAWVDIPAQQKGTRMPFSCSMGMYTGDIIFDQ